MAVALLKAWTSRNIGDAPPQPVPMWVDALLLIVDAMLQGPGMQDTSRSGNTETADSSGPANANEAAGPSAQDTGAPGSAAAAQVLRLSAVACACLCLVLCAFHLVSLR